jgi:hypothetical protein
MGCRLNRHLGTVHTMLPGQFTIRTASGNPAVSCPVCGTIYEIPATHRWDEGGRVVPALKCADPACSFLEYVELGAINEEVLP